MEWPFFFFTLHSYEHVPALNQFQIKRKKTDWLLLQNTRSGVLHLHPHCVFDPIQSRGSSSWPVCKKTCFKTFYGGELKNFPMQTNNHCLIFLFLFLFFIKKQPSSNSSIQKLRKHKTYETYTCVLVYNHHIPD